MQQLNPEERKELQRQALNSGHYEYYISNEKELRDFDVLAAMFENDEIFQYYNDLIEGLLDRGYENGLSQVTIVLTYGFDVEEYEYDNEGNLKLNAYLLPEEDFEHGRNYKFKEIFASFLSFLLEYEGYETEIETNWEFRHRVAEEPAYLHIYL